MTKKRKLSDNDQKQLNGGKKIIVKSIMIEKNSVNKKKLDVLMKKSIVKEETQKCR